MALSEIVSVTIQAGTVNPARRGYGTPFLLAYHDSWTDGSVHRYTSFSGVSDEFDPADMPYLWAAAMFGQKPRPKEIKIGQRAWASNFCTQKIDATDMASGVAIVGSIVNQTGVATALNIAWNTDLATTLGALKTAIDAVTGIGTCTLASPVLTVPADAAGMFHLSFSTKGVDVRDVTADLGLDTAMAAAVLLDPNFYMVFSDTNSPKNMDKLARWALANDRFAMFGPQYTKPAQFVSGEFAAGADYTALLANDATAGLFTAADRRSFKEAAWAGKLLPKDPGSATWAFKPLAGVGADLWNATQRGVIEGYHGNHYVAEAQVGITRPGKAFGGEWIDVVIGLAWLESTIQERLFTALINNDKISYTDEDMPILVAEVRGALKAAERAKVIAKGWDVTIPLVADQDPGDKAARIVRHLEFTATLAGAVHQVDVIGTVTP